jgi:catechol 2,3-dioxygenase-like lactoylglutathione lyase family enzyme
VNFKPHHVGCAVRDIESGVRTYSGSLKLARRTREFEVTSQGVSVCFLQLHEGFYLELVEPREDRAKLSEYLKFGFYHLCFLTEDVGAARVRLKERGFMALPRFSSEAFSGASCQFFVSGEGHLIELAEMRQAEFQSFFDASLATARDDLFNCGFDPK